MAGLNERFKAVRRATEDLARPLSPEDCGVQSMPEASPTKWHLAHTSWFFETFLLDAPTSPGYRPFHPAFRTLFNSYYNAVGDRHARPARGLLSRPSLDEVHAYRRHVDEAMLRALDRRDAALVVLGLHHEQQHQELILTDIKHAFWMNPLRPAYAPRARRSGSLATRSRRRSPGASTRAARWRSARPARAPAASRSHSTTNARGTRSCCGRTRWRRAW